MDTNPETERRRLKRFRKELAIAVRSEDGSEQKCVTRDVSAGGVFFLAGREVLPDSAIQFMMMLPAEIAGWEQRWVSCYGHVVRVEDLGSGQFGVAVNVDRVVFLPEPLSHSIEIL